MLYELDEGFDMEGWRQEVSGSNTKRRTYSPEVVRDLAWPTDRQRSPKHLEKKTLAKLVMDACGCGRTKAYELIDQAQARGFVRFSKLSQSYAKA